MEKDFNWYFENLLNFLVEGKIKKQQYGFEYQIKIIQNIIDIKALFNCSSLLLFSKVDICCIYYYKSYKPKNLKKDVEIKNLDSFAKAFKLANSNYFA